MLLLSTVLRKKSHICADWKCRQRATNSEAGEARVEATLEALGFQNFLFCAFHQTGDHYLVLNREQSAKTRAMFDYLATLDERFVEHGVNEEDAHTVVVHVSPLQMAFSRTEVCATKDEDHCIVANHHGKWQGTTVDVV